MTTPITPKEHLNTFLRAYLVFAEGGQNPFGFTKRNGLCIELFEYTESLGLERHDVFDLEGEITDVLSEEFIKVGLDTMLPFGGINYTTRAASHTQHEDPARLAFIRNFLSTN